MFGVDVEFGRRQLRRAVAIIRSPTRHPWGGLMESVGQMLWRRRGGKVGGVS